MIRHQYRKQFLASFFFIILEGVLYYSGIDYDEGTYLDVTMFIVVFFPFVLAARNKKTESKEADIPVVE